jgi:hypothetical protein
MHRKRDGTVRSRHKSSSRTTRTLAGPPECQEFANQRTSPEIAIFCPVCVIRPGGQPRIPGYRYLGSYIAVCTIPNFLGLDHWQTFCQHGGNGGGLLALGKDDPARTYLGFKADEPLDYGRRDVIAQKRLLADRLAGMGWVFPQILKYMQESSDFYFDSINQIRMDRWSDGRVVLLGDAGYAVSLATGQGTSVAMIAAYVLAGELAAHTDEPLAGLRSYEHELRDYVLRNQELATNVDLPEPESSDTEGGDAMINPDSLPDFGEQAIPFDLKSYEHLSWHGRRDRATLPRSRRSDAQGARRGYLDDKERAFESAC